MSQPTAPLRSSAVALAASMLMLCACERPGAPASPEPQPAPAPQASPAPKPPPVLDRTGLLQAIDAAASAYAAGEPLASEGLAGRRFLIRQAFGCAGPAAPVASEDAGEGLGRWTWGGDGKSIQIDLQPGDWTRSALIAGGAASWEAVQGFWLTRPWLRAEGCPGAARDPLVSGLAAPSPQSAGVAAVFEEGGSRLERRNGRAYSFVVRGQGDQPADPKGGYRLVLEGRLAAFEDGRAIRCRAASPDQRPVCIAAAVVDRVAFEEASGALLTEWRMG